MKIIKNFVIGGVLGFIIVPFISFAQSSTISVSSTLDASSSAPLINETKKSPMDGVVLFFNRMITVTDTWRSEQEIIWKNVQEQKEKEVALREEKMDAEILSRSDQVLAEQQTTVIQGMGDDFDGSIFLLKVYIFVLSVFVYIFSTPWLFYLVFGILIYNILRTIYEKIIDYRRTSDF